MAAMKKPVAKPTAKSKDGSNTKPFNVQLIKPKDIIEKKPATKAPAKKLVGPAAVAELKKQVSKAGVKKSEMKQREAIDKKYPGLYKKSK